MAHVNGAFQNRIIRDTCGRTDNSVGGFGNNVKFVGDSGRNRFSVGGMQNNVEVNNLGADDTVNLQGPGWVALPDSNACDGKVSYYNVLTGSSAQVNTDDGRNDAFVRARVNGANGAATCGCWNNLGYMDQNASAYAAGYQSGFAAGYNTGSWNRVGSFLNFAALGPLAFFAF